MKDGGYGHASALNETQQAPPKGICLEAHPLLENVRCQRLRGHPGKHGAEVETRSTEIYLEWATPDEAPEDA